MAARERHPLPRRIASSALCPPMSGALPAFAGIVEFTQHTRAFSVPQLGCVLRPPCR
ncbi:hypothetical protein [Actinomadura sp. 3N407]|uniref:hypothetical protein n=1 Tax=Actinomadura sp. 3N407 TaxID=3457423 RepID=UPI003FCD2B60